MTARASGARRVVKRTARSLWARTHRALGALHGDRATPGLRLLTYHRVALDPADPFCVPPVSFRSQMECLAAGGRVGGLDEALEDLMPGRNAEPRIVITVDDGTEDFMHEVLPVLVRLALPAVIYVSPLRVGRPGFMTWAHLREAAGCGVAVGSHGLDHRSFGRMTNAEAEEQAIRSKSILEDRLGLEVTSLAYPYGTLRDFNAGVRQAVRKAGYRSACTSLNGINRAGADLLELRRTKVEQGDDAIFPWILGGALDGWYVVDRYLSLLQNRYA